MSEIKVVIVDDHKSFAEGLSMVIENAEQNMAVLGTAEDRESLEPMLELSPDIILLDIDLGETSSLMFLPDLAGSTDARIIVITGLRDPAIHEEAIAKGARGVLLKNEQASTILKAIRKVHEGEVWADSHLMSRVLDRMKFPAPSRSKGPAEDLTARELEIVRALVMFEASTNKEIADNLNISTSTLKNHLTTIFSKLGIRNRVQLIKFALSNKIAEPPA
ncbi:MAG TPA: response regulator transcription factor [Aridibacter sp.]|nr:response regulator transcription factor [Aridibacter sp.]